MEIQNFTPGQSIPKIKQYCSYQERCHAEVRDKLFSFGLSKKEIDFIISSLIEENFLNEERFAVLFAGGKFRMKKWGKIKIKQALKMRQVSDYCINKALKEIDDRDYQKTFNQLAERKIKTLKSEKNIFVKKRKIQDFLLSKGFENKMINELLSDLGK